MKIGIITQPLIANYGGTLQNFALHQVLKLLGHDPITIDYIQAPISYFRYVLSLCKSMALFFIPNKRRPFTIRHIPKRNAIMEAFVRKHIAVTRQVSSYTPDLIKEYGLEAIITGSDQVWRPRYNRFLEDMFLRFAKDARIKKVVYAASFGVDFWEYTDEQTVACKKWIQQLDSVSVREASGIDLCKRYFNVEAIEVLDPTLLLDKEDYENVCKDVPKEEKSFVASYILDFTPEKERFICKMAAEKGLSVRIFSAGKDMKWSVEEWLSMFRDADYIVTDSFHGTVFSIIFNKSFISIGNPSRGMSRFYSLLDKFGLQQCLLAEDNLEDGMLRDVDWEYTNRIRNEWKMQAFDFLNHSL